MEINNKVIVGVGFVALAAAILFGWFDKEKPEKKKAPKPFIKTVVPNDSKTFECKCNHEDIEKRVAELEGQFEATQRLLLASMKLNGALAKDLKKELDNNGK